jgi:hypothetical protein
LLADMLCCWLRHLCFATVSSLTYAYRHCLLFTTLCAALLRCAARQGLAFLFLLPVVAVALALTIVTVNLDPTGPQLQLTLKSLEQYTPGEWDGSCVCILEL